MADNRKASEDSYKQSSAACDGEYVTQTDHIKYLGAYLDNNLNLKQHINNKCKTDMWNIQRIKQIRNLLTKEACETPNKFEIC